MPNPTSEIEVPPFPPLRWAEYGWEGVAVIPAWAGFQSRGGAYGSRDSAKPSDGRVRLNIASPHVNNREQPSVVQRKTYEVFLSQQQRIREAMLAELLGRYEAWRSTSADMMDKEEFEELMPPVSETEGFRNLIGLSNIHLLTEEMNGQAYIGFEFGCTWDDEHGLGFMMHGDRVVKLGDADSSFLEWIAERDIKAHGGPAGV